MYIDLNPLAADITFLPEKSPYTSITERVEHAWPKTSHAELAAALRGLVVVNLPAGDVEQTHWLCPIEDRREQGATREGMVAGFSLPKYLLLLDYTAYIFRQGKVRLSADVAPIFERLGTTAELWEQRLTQLKTSLACRKLTGRFLATTWEVLSVVARRLGLHHLVNLQAGTTCPQRSNPLRRAESAHSAGSVRVAGNRVTTFCTAFPTNFGRSLTASANAPHLALPRANAQPDSLAHRFHLAFSSQRIGLQTDQPEQLQCMSFSFLMSIVLCQITC